MMSRRVGILTGGGDAPGLNAVIRAVVKRGVGQLGWQVVGIQDSFNGLFSDLRHTWDLTPRSCQGLLQRGGTILGTTNRGDPFDFPCKDGVRRDRSPECASGVVDLGLEGLICIGGDGTQAMALRLMNEQGIPVVGVPKTIDNDLEATDYTFGFQSAVDCATDAIDRLHTTAESHDRIMFLEVMGRDAGHIALSAGIAGGADIILLPEIPYDPAAVARKVHMRKAVGRPFSIVVVGEGALPVGLGRADLSSSERKAILKERGGAAQIAMAAIGGLVDAECRATVLGHLQRGGSPVAFDRVLATRFGVGAVDLVEAGRWGEMVRLRNGRIEGVPLEIATSRNRTVDADGELVRTARSVGICLGDE
jgi:6-phosphofructokinase 1